MGPTKDCKKPSIYLKFLNHIQNDLAPVQCHFSGLQTHLEKAQVFVRNLESGK